MLKAQEAVVILNRFYEIWNSLFPLCVNRPWCDIPGKCDVCCHIDRLRRTTNSDSVLLACKKAHLLHRGGMFNQERAKYKERVIEALLDDPRNPSIMSIIIDGMDNNKCRCPYLGRQGSFSSPIPQHIIGVKEHGHGATFYRTFGTVTKGADITIYCILRKIEEWYRRNKKYPTKIYIQIDGATDNANRYLFGMLELLVSKKIAKSIVLTRLPVGHTHEDIDALFGTIYNSFKNSPAETLSKYKNVINNAFKKIGFNTKVEDVYCIPNYKDFINDCIDTNISHMHRLEETQLQWRFESVKPDIFFPHGVKTTYKAFSSNQVVEFVIGNPCDNLTPVGQLTGLEPKTTFNTWNPAPFGANSLQDRQGVEGFHILRSLPTAKKFKFKKFVDTSVELIANNIIHIKLEYRADTFKDIHDEWAVWHDTKAPLITDGGVDGYVDRILNVSQLANVIFIPLEIDILSPVPVININWSVTHIYSDLHDPTFQWPEQLQAAMNSVTYTGNLSPPPPRLSSTSDETLKNSVNTFKEIVANFYTDIKSRPLKYLKDKVMNQVLYDGEATSLQVTKSQAVSKMETWGRYFTATIFKPIGSLHQALIENYSNCTLNPDNYNEIISSHNVPEIQVYFNCFHFT